MKHFSFHYTDETEKLFLKRNSDYLQTSWSARKLQQSLYTAFLFYVHCKTSSESWYLPNFHSLAEIISVVYDSQKEGRKKKKKEKGMKIQEVCFLRYDEHPRHFYRRVSGPGRM